MKQMKSETVIENPYEIKDLEDPKNKPDPNAKTDSVEAQKEKAKEETKEPTVANTPVKIKDTKAPDKSAPKVIQPITKNSEATKAALEKETELLAKQFPFQAGERIEYTVRYFALEAGHFTFEIKPIKQIQGRPVLHFYVSARTSSIFAWVYTLKDFAESFWDMKFKRPYLMKIYGEESRYVREVQTTFDWQKRQARYQAKIIEIGKGLDEEDKSWTLNHLEAQDVVSALYFLRTKDLAVGKVFDFRVAEMGKDILVRAKVTKEEEINTKLGKFMTYVVKPTFSVNGHWKQKGEVTLWLTKDQYKAPIQFEAKIKVGTIRGKLNSLKH